jgi:hypothetical protein
MAFACGAFIFIKGHPILAFFQFIISLLFSAGNLRTISENNKYIDKWRAINNIEISSTPLSDTNPLKTIPENVGNLDFRFNKEE